MRTPNVAPPKVYTLDYPKLTGGLNTAELDYRLRPNESPFMVNMWWLDGVLQTRFGKRAALTDLNYGKMFTCYPYTWFEYAFFHAGDALYCFTPLGSTTYLKKLQTGVPAIRGTFFRYFDSLFYKTEGAFYQITHTPDGFEVKDVFASAYVPTIQINSNPQTGAGDLYQPENRLTATKKIGYTAKADATVYQLPVKAIDSVDEVKVDGAVTDKYSVDLAVGKITFQSAPPVTDPPTLNSVEITYTKKNPGALEAIKDCRYATVAGGDRDLCILLAGSKAQPNAVFWNTNDSVSMNPAYWPIEGYNLIGATDERVTGFGAQYKDTIVFKEHTVGRLDFQIEEIDKRKIPAFNYTQINGRTGCDLPWTIQLIENNLVFANTYQGVHLLRSSSPAYENNVRPLSLKIDEPCKVSGYSERPGGRGLLAELRAGEEDSICSADDDTRYWICVNGVSYAWDYTISREDDPAWFPMVGLDPVSWFIADDRTPFFLAPKNTVYALDGGYQDEGEPMEKVYRFPTTDFGVPGYLKDVVDAVFVTRSETDTKIRVKYVTDLEERADRTNIENWTWNWEGMNLAGVVIGVYNLLAPRYAAVSRRKPKCRHIGYFGMELSDVNAGDNMAIVSAQVQYIISEKRR